MAQCHHEGINGGVFEDRLDYVWHSILGLVTYGVVENRDECREIYVYQVRTILGMAFTNQKRMKGPRR